jgi:hypothetical protein
VPSSRRLGAGIATRTNVPIGRVFVPVLPRPDADLADSTSGDTEPGLGAPGRSLEDGPETGFWSAIDGVHPG